MLRTNDFGIFFKHYDSETVMNSALKLPNLPVHAATKVTIELYDDDETAEGQTVTDTIEAIAFCSINDTFSKAKGRKIALRKAIHGTGETRQIDREFATRIWNAYHKALKNDKQKSILPLRVAAARKFLAEVIMPV